MEMNRPQCGCDATVTRTFDGFSAVADWTRTRIVHGHGLDADIRGPDTVTDMD